MDIVSKIFWSNIFLLTCVYVFNIHERDWVKGWTVKVVRLWDHLTVISIVAYVVYLIWTW